MDGPLGPHLHPNSHPLSATSPPASTSLQARRCAPRLVNHTAPAISQATTAVSCQARQRLQSGQPSVIFRASGGSGARGPSLQGGQMRLT